MSNEDEVVNLQGTQEIELPTIDITPYIGQKTKIETVIEKKGHYGFYIHLQTEVVDTLDGIKEPILIRGSRIFGLQEDKDQNIGWGKDTKLGVFLKSMDVTHYKELEGKEVILQSRTTKEGQKFLTFD